MTTEATNLPASGLAHFPVSFFAVLLGAFGLTIALVRGSGALGLPPALGEAALWISGALLVLIAVTYAAKALRYPGQIAWEWAHPVRINFFPAMAISLMLLATALSASGRLDVARPIWLFGAFAQLVLTFAVISSWISHRKFLPGQLGPAWFIPAVGNVVAPVAGVQLGYFDVSWYFYSVGILFWVILLVLVMNRLIFHDPIPTKLQPTLVIMVAPPAIGFIAHTELTGALDPMARILFNTTLLFTGILLTQLPRLFRVPFSMAFWALSFPVAAFTLACFRYAALTGKEAFNWVGAGSLTLLVAVIAVLTANTLRGLLGGTICVPE